MTEEPITYTYLDTKEKQKKNKYIIFYLTLTSTKGPCVRAQKIQLYTHIYSQTSTYVLLKNNNNNNNNS